MKTTAALTLALAGSAAAFAPQTSVNKVAAPRYVLDSEVPFAAKYRGETHDGPAS